MKLGYTEKKIALLEYGITLALGLLGVFSPAFLKPYVLIIAWLFVAAVVISTTSKAYEQ